MDVRAKAVRCSEMGFADEIVGGLPEIPHHAVKRWPYAHRALGKGALFAAKHKTCPRDLKAGAAKAVVEGGMPKPEAMKAHGLRSKTQMGAWRRLYREGGADALLPRPKGRPRKAGASFSSREEELGARVRELGPENEILKRFNALAEGIERKRQTR